MCTLVCACMKLYGTKLLHKSRRTRLKRRLIIIFVSLKNCAFMENLNSDININVIWSCTIMKLIYWGLTLRFTASSAIKYHERKGKENEMKWNEHDDSSWSWLYMAVRFGLRESDTHLTDSSIAQSQHPHGSRPVVTLLKVLRRESSEMGLPIHTIHRMYNLYSCRCIRMCELVYVTDDVVWAMAN